MGIIAAGPLVRRDEARVEAKDRVRELVDRAVRGDAEAFGSLYDHFSEQVYRYFFHHVGSAADAEDLVSRTFLRSWRAMPKFRWREKPFEAWLFTVARNQLIDFHRENRSQGQTEPLGDAAYHFRDDRPGPEAIALASARAATTREALARLTFEQREVIILKFFLGHENREISRIMGKREGTVRALQMRALQALRRHLSDV